MKHFIVICTFIVFASTLAIGLLVLAPCREGIVSECNYEKIKTGMTVAEAEAILGPGREVAKKHVPQLNGPVVSGERFFRWSRDGTRVIKVCVGIRNGKVCDKWYWEPSL